MAYPGSLPMNLSCPYCGNPAVLVTGQVIYPHRSDLFDKKFWQCQPCDAYVGCHSGGTTPLGRLANNELRKAKMSAHAAFDPIWQSEEMTRSEAYAWLAKTLHISADDCHVGMFDLVTCMRVVAACKGRGTISIPQPLASPNLTSLTKVCQERLLEYEKGEDTDSDTPHYIYESAMEAIFGKEVWAWTTAISAGRAQTPTIVPQ